MEVFVILWQYVPVYSRVNLTSNIVMTLPLRCATSTSPSMLMTLLILAVTSPSFASTLGRLSSNHLRAHGDASLFTQCQLLGLCRTMLAVVEQERSLKVNVCLGQRRSLRS